MTALHPQQDFTKYRELAKVGVAWILSTTIFWQLISWGLTLTTARLLTPDDFGLLAMNEAVLPYLLMVAVLRLDAWIVQRVTITQSEERAAWNVSLALGVVSTTIAVLTAPIISKFFNEPRLSIPFQVAAFTLFFKAAQIVPDGRLRRSMEFKSLSIINLSVGMIRGLTQVALAYLGFSYWSLIIGLLVGEALLTALLYWRAGAPFESEPDYSVIRPAVKYGLHATTSAILWILFSTADDITVGKLFGPHELGIYSMAFFLAELPISKINGMLYPLLLSYFSRVKSSRSEVRLAFLKLNSMISSLVFPALTGLFLIAHDGVLVAMGQGWSNLIIPLQIMTGVGLLRSAVAGATPIFLALDQPKRLMKWSLVNALTLPPFFIIGAQLYGLLGVYIAWLTIYPATGVALLVWQIGKFTDVTPSDYLRCVAPPFFCSLVMFIVCLSTATYLYPATASDGGSLMRLSATTLLGFTTYFAAYFVLFRNDFEDYLQAISSLRGVVRQLPNTHE